MSNIFIANENLRKQFIDTIDRNGYSHLNTLGIAACQAAYTYGDVYKRQV